MKRTANLLATAALIAPVIISSVPINADAAVREHKDVSKNSPYYDIIHEMAKQGIISGYEDGSFKPSQAITRKHASALVSRAKGGSLPVNGKAYQFNDVTKNNPYYEDIRKLQQAGIFEPDKNGNFHPNKVVTRAEMAKILTIAFNLDIKANYDFPDVPASHPSNEYVRAIYSNGITTGDNGKFLPNDTLSRAHYAVFMYRAMNVDNTHVPQPVPKPTPPVVKPDPKPEKPTPPSKPGNSLFPDPYSIKVPSGWNESVLKEYQKKVIAEVRNSGQAFGINSYVLSQLVYEPNYLSYPKNALKEIGTSVTFEEWVEAVNYVIKTGELYIAPDGTFGLYASYVSNTAIIKFAR